MNKETLETFIVYSVLIIMFSLFIVMYTSIIPIREYHTIEGIVECVEIQTFRNENNLRLQYIITIDGEDHILRPYYGMRSNKHINLAFEIGGYYAFNVFDEWNTYGLNKCTDGFLYLDQSVRIEGECQ